MEFLPLQPSRLATIQTFKEIYALNIYFYLLLKFTMHLRLYG